MKLRPEATLVVCILRILLHFALSRISNIHVYTSYLVIENAESNSLMNILLLQLDDDRFAAPHRQTTDSEWFQGPRLLLPKRQRRILRGVRFRPKQRLIRLRFDKSLGRRGFGGGCGQRFVSVRLLGAVVKLDGGGTSCAEKGDVQWEIFEDADDLHVGFSSQLCFICLQRERQTPL